MSTTKKKIRWDQIGERKFETGVSNGVLYPGDGSGGYKSGVAWNGLTNVQESPSGAEPNPIYADNIKLIWRRMNLQSAMVQRKLRLAYMRVSRIEKNLASHISLLSVMTLRAQITDIIYILYTDVLRPRLIRIIHLLMKV